MYRNKSLFEIQVHLLLIIILQYCNKRLTIDNSNLLVFLSVSWYNNPMWDVRGIQGKLVNHETEMRMMTYNKK